MRQEQSDLIDLIKYALSDRELPDRLRSLSVEERKRIVRYAEKQGVFPFLQYFDIFFDDNELNNICLKKMAAYISRDSRQDSERNNLLDAFEKNGIYCIALKGSRTKKLYPSTELRTMGDLDILYKAEQTGLLKKVMKEFGYKYGGEMPKHDCYEKNGNMVEMHRELFDDESVSYPYFQKVWKKARPEDGKQFIWEMTLEDHYIHTICHLREHFIHKGSGIRMVLDVYIISQRPELSWEYIINELKKLEIDKFETRIRELAQYWFSEKDGHTDKPEMYEELSEYIVNGGIFGSTENGRQNNAIQFRSKGQYIWQVVFPSYKVMQAIFPWLKTPVLLPFAWCYRWVNVLAKKRKNIQKQFIRAEETMNLNREYGEKRKAFFEKCGL